MKSKEIVTYSFSTLIIIFFLYIIAVLIHVQFFSSSSHKTNYSPLTRAIRRVQNWRQLPLTGYRAGPERAPVQIIEFFDYQCPFCKAAQPAIKAIRKKYPEDLTIIYEDLPLRSHPYAYKAAIAAECARLQGAFMAYHDKLFASQKRLGRLSYTRLAAQAGVADTSAFRQCIVSRKTAHTVDASGILATG